MEMSARDANDFDRGGSPRLKEQWQDMDSDQKAVYLESAMQVFPALTPHQIWSTLLGSP